MSRPPRSAALLSSRDRLKLDFTRSAQLRDLYPQLSEVRVELQFEDINLPAPSSQSFSIFPGARGFFRFSCPCHTCSGEFDLSTLVAELAKQVPGKQHTRRFNQQCAGQRLLNGSGLSSCQIRAQVFVCATVRGKEGQ